MKTFQTPFSNLKNFEPHILKIVDFYSGGKLKRNLCHYFVVLGLCDNYKMALRSACLQGYLEMVKYLVDMLNIDKFSGEELRLRESLKNASRYGHIEVVKFIMALDNIYSYQDDLNIFLVQACQGGHMRLVKYLISLIEGELDFDTHVICEAAASGNIDLVKYLINMLNESKENSSTFVFDKQDLLNHALSVASSFGNLDIVKYLCHLGASVSEYECIIEAATCGKLDVIKYFVSLGHCVDVEMVMIASAGKSHIHVVDYAFSFIENDKKEQDRILNSTSILRRTAYLGDLKTFKHLVALGAKVESNPIVFVSACNGKLDILKYIVSFDVDFTSFYCESFFDAACHGSTDIMRYLVHLCVENYPEPGPIINDMINYEDGAICVAAENDDLEAVEYLVSLGADKHIHEDYAFCWACRNEHPRIVKYLISICSTTIDRHNPPSTELSRMLAFDRGRALRWAVETCNLEIVKMLVSAGSKVHADHIETASVYPYQNEQVLQYLQSVNGV